MTPAANLGGSSQPRNQSGTGSVEADFLDAYQDPLTLQWLARVRLDGGRVLDGVRFIYPSARPATGSRPVLPAKGERGIVLYPSSARQVRLSYWLGSVDGYTFGLHVDHPDAAVQVHPSGQASLTDKDGNHAFRFVNGDRIVQDDTTSDLTSHYRPKEQRQASASSFESLARSEYQPEARAKLDLKSRWYYDGLKGGALFGGDLKLFKDKHGVNRISTVATDLLSGVITLKTEGDRIKAGAGLSSEDATFKVNLIEIKPKKEGHLSIDASGGTALLNVKKPGADISLKMDTADKSLRLESDEIIFLKTKLAQMEADIAEIKAKQDITLKAPQITLDSAQVKAGSGASIPVSLSTVVDANFKLITLRLGIPFLPTGAKTLVTL